LQPIVWRYKKKVRIQFISEGGYSVIFEKELKPTILSSLEIADLSFSQHLQRRNST
jgi:hypothetical protein